MASCDLDKLNIKARPAKAINSCIMSINYHIYRSLH